MKQDFRIKSLVMTTATLALISACTTTTIKPNPGKHDRGIRYYRPKPYLLLEPFEGNSKEFVGISLQYLPDFSEEYSIRVRAGAGINKTSLKLEDGWNLTEISQELDSQTDENIKAVGDLLGSVSGLIKPTSGDQTDRSTPKFVVQANNVPLGYYESVISPGPDGKKRLYGWRYVGFMPFNGCPTEASGLQCVNCGEGVVFGLTIREGVMTFVPIEHIGHTPMFRGPEAVSDAAASADNAESSSPSDGLDEDNRESIAIKAANILTDQLALPLDVSPTDVKVAQEHLTIVLTIPARLFDELVDRMKLDPALTSLRIFIRGNLGNNFDVALNKP